MRVELSCGCVDDGRTLTRCHEHRVGRAYFPEMQNVAVPRTESGDRLRALKIQENRALLDRITTDFGVVEKRILDSMRMRQGPASGINAVFGGWPGEETDEQVETALRDRGTCPVFYITNAADGFVIHCTSSAGHPSDHTDVIGGWEPRFVVRKLVTNKLDFGLFDSWSGVCVESFLSPALALNAARRLNDAVPLDSAARERRDY